MHFAIRDCNDIHFVHGDVEARSLKEVIISEFERQIETAKAQNLDHSVVSIRKLQAAVELLKNSVSKLYADQIKWERDVALRQLSEIGKGFGERMDDIIDLLGRK